MEELMKDLDTHNDGNRSFRNQWPRFYYNTPSNSEVYEMGGDSSAGWWRNWWKEDRILKAVLGST